MSTLADIQHPQALAAATHALDLFHIAPDIMVRSPITPDKIETFPDVEKTHVSDAKQIAEFYAALEAASPKATRTSVEYRWKAVAYDAAGERIAELYASAISHFGRYGEHTTFEFSNDAFAKVFAELSGAENALTH